MNTNDAAIECQWELVAECNPGSPALMVFPTSGWEAWKGYWVWSKERQGHVDRRAGLPEGAEVYYPFWAYPIYAARDKRRGAICDRGGVSWREMERKWTAGPRTSHVNFSDPAFLRAFYDITGRAYGPRGPWGFNA